MKRVFIGVFLLLTAFAAACYWDYDTFSEEARGKLDVVDALVGRVRRFPPVYYEKRIEINVPRAQSGNFDAYDNVAVAYSRLGKQDEAIKWIRAKRTAMKQSPDRVTDDIRYRTEANEGTFWLVKWLSSRPEAAKDEWLQVGREMIARAIAINPEAHFGREKVQLDYMDWCLNKGEGKSFGSYLADRDEIAGDARAQAKVREGLVGLVMLGAAWENPDILGAIPTRSIGRSGSAKESDTTFVKLANLRISELTGKPEPQVPDDGPWATNEWMPFQPQNIKVNFKRLRENAKEYQANLSDFVTRRIKEGFHPDKDGDRFWEGYEPTPRAELVDPPFDISVFGHRYPGLVLALVATVGFGTIFFVGWIFRRLLRPLR